MRSHSPPIFLKGRGAGVGYKSFVHKFYAHPTPTPPLKWEGSGCAR